MLDTIFKSGASRRQEQDELRELLTQVRDEREALAAMLTRMNVDSAARTRDAQANVAALRQESAQFDELRSRLREATAEVTQSAGTIASLKSELDALRQSESQLREELQAIRDGAHAARDDASAAAGAVQGVEHKLQAFAQLQELSATTEQRLASLNALAEHVSLKVKALETQKQTVERAVVEATRLNEMVWNMDTQIARLTQGGEQMRQAEDAVARMEEVARVTAQQLAAAGTAQEEFARESTRIENQGRAVAEQLRATVERLSIDKEEIDAFDQRLQAMARSVADTQASVQSLAAKQQALAAIERKTDAIDKAFTTLQGRADELAQRQSGLDSLAAQLAQVEGLGKRTAAQHESLLQAQRDVEAVRGELAQFHQAHAEAMQLRDQLAVDRAALDAFGERAAALLSRTPELEARMTTVLGRLSLVDDGNRAVARLDERCAELDAQVTRVEARVQFVEKLEQRVNGLHLLTAGVERKLADQLTRRAEVEGVKNLCDTLLTQVVDAQQKLDGVAALQGRVMPMVTQVSTLMQTLERSQQLVQSLKIDEAQVQQQRAQFAELTEQGKALAAETAERLKQVRGVSDDLGRAATLTEELHAELARVQATQRDAIAQTEAAEEQMRRADAMARQAQQHCTQVLHGEEKVTALEGRLADLDRSADAVEQKIHALGDQEVLVQAVKAEVENIRQISSRSKADLQFVSEHRNDVSELRDKIEDLLERVRDTDGKIELIESRRRMVEEVQARANSIAHMLEDIQVNLEMLGEQRAVVDHVGEKLARLDFTLQEAHNTLRALQREREVAERIEQGIKALRSTRNGAASDTAAVGS
jgi:chromosome segregation ATPase